ncbi:hypothetical protein Q7P37_008394 [Cladosporium fusiforme]
MTQSLGPASAQEAATTCHAEGRAISIRSISRGPTAVPRLRACSTGQQGATGMRMRRPRTRVHTNRSTVALHRVGVANRHPHARGALMVEPVVTPGSWPWSRNGASDLPQAQAKNEEVEEEESALGDGWAWTSADPTTPSAHEAVLPTANRFTHADGALAPLRWPTKSRKSASTASLDSAPHGQLACAASFACGINPPAGNANGAVSGSAPTARSSSPPIQGEQPSSHPSTVRAHAGCCYQIKSSSPSSRSQSAIVPPQMIARAIYSLTNLVPISDHLGATLATAGAVWTKILSTSSRAFVRAWLLLALQRTQAFTVPSTQKVETASSSISPLSSSLAKRAVCSSSEYYLVSDDALFPEECIDVPSPPPRFFFTSDSTFTFDGSEMQHNELFSNKHGKLLHSPTRLYHYIPSELENYQHPSVGLFVAGSGPYGQTHFTSETTRSLRYASTIPAMKPFGFQAICEELLDWM